MSVPYAAEEHLPGIILKPTDTVSKRFTPKGSFVLFASGTVTGTLKVFGIPTVILEDDDITDKSSYWTDLEASDPLANSDKVASYRCTDGLTVEVRPSAASTCYLLWGYMYQPIWVSVNAGV